MDECSCIFIPFFDFYCAIKFHSLKIVLHIPESHVFSYLTGKGLFGAKHSQKKIGKKFTSYAMEMEQR